MSPKNSTRVGLAGSTNKRSITMTLTVTLDGKILPFQIIYGGKTDQSQVLTRSTIATLRKLSNIFIKLLYHTSMRREKNRRCWSICITDMESFSWPENRSGKFFTARAKNIEWVCNKQHDRLFPGTRSHSQQMGKRLYETAVQRMVPNNELESEKKLENITIKFVLSTMKPLHSVC